MGNNKTLYLDEFLALDTMPISMDMLEFESFGESIYKKYRFDNDSEHICMTHNLRKDFTEINIKKEEINIKDEGIDLYKPRQVRGVGSQREGYCKECDKWFKLKTSSYWYHMNFKHGINAQGVKYPEPITRKTNLGIKAMCDICDKWIHLGSRYNKKSIKYNWYKHWQKEHRDMNGSS